MATLRRVKKTGLTEFSVMASMIYFLNPFIFHLKILGYIPKGHDSESSEMKTIHKLKYVKLIMFIWKPTLAIFRVTKTDRSASR